SRMALQLFRNERNASAWSSAAQPSSAENCSGEICAPGSRTILSAACALIVPALSASATPNMRRPASNRIRSLPAFGGEKLPVRIARREVARERPHVGDVGDLVGIAVDHIAV